tara:strand:- start:238 stop:390 length:153 start_codon:yes stop_codon:yes gene_type:complete
MSYSIELYGTKKGIVVNTNTNHHFSSSPIAINKAKAQLRLLQGIKNKKKL